MRFLLATTGLGAIATCLTAVPANAETVISTAITTPVLTGTANDDIRISSTGSVKPTGGAAVTINSNDSVKNEGAIAIIDANNATGILANTNLSGDITNAGTITTDENYTPTDTDNDGDLDGPFAQGTGRFGIHVLGGGTFTGNVLNSGTITVEGNQSAGIAIDSALVGSLTQTGGLITVTGNDSAGIRAAAVSGNVILSNGVVAVKGQNSIGVDLTGNIGGALVIQNAISATGYRNTTAPADVSKLDADDLLQGGPAVSVAGDVAGGILLDARPADLDPNNADEDNDGIPDANESTAAITSFGAAPALRIGSGAVDTTIGAVASSTDGYGIVVKGTVIGSGVYKGVNASAILVGGLGHLVNVAGGMGISGTVSASAVEGNATAIRLGSGANVPVVNISGNVGASGGGTASTGAQTILIEAGANVGTIKNSGTILAVRAGTDGSASVIVDQSGSLALVENSGSIAVTDFATLADKAVAIDLRANTTGATVRQNAAATGKPAPEIKGNILFGSGADTLDIQAGSVFGKVDFGGGADVFNLAGSSLFRGTLAGSAGLALTVGTGSTLDLQNLGTVDLASLNVATGGTIGVTIGATSNTLYNVAGTADFGADSKILVTLNSVATAVGSYTIIDAGTLVGGDNLSSVVATLPFLFSSDLTTSAVDGTVTLEVKQKTSGELGLNSSESAILPAALAAADADLGIAGIFLSAADSATLRNTLQQLMPEHAGGAFETATKGSRLVSGLLADPHAAVTERNGIGLWLQQVAWGASKSIGDTASYKVNGWGAAGGVEKSIGGLGAVGLSAAYYSGKDNKGNNELFSNNYEGGVYWRGGIGPFHAFARGTVGSIHFDGTRNFSALLNTVQVERSADGKWNGTLYSAVGGASYELRTGRLSIRPSAMIEHFSLKEKGYSETGTSHAFNLTVRSRSSSETAADGLLTVGYDLLGLDPASAWLRVEVEGGWRHILSGKLGDTVASFEGGQPFTLTPEQRTSGWRTGVRLTGGGSGVTFTGEVLGEEQRGKASLGGRVGVSFAL
ncbi:MAG: autotransporter domain-containing protein [Sphingomicrobium sp.]